MPSSRPTDSEGYITAAEIDKSTLPPPGPKPLDRKDSTSTETLKMASGGSGAENTEKDKLIKENETLLRELANTKARLDSMENRARSRTREREGRRKEKKKDMIQETLESVRKQAKRLNLDSTLLTQEGVLDQYGFDQNQREGYTGTSASDSGEDQEVFLGRGDTNPLTDILGDSFKGFRTKSNRKYMDKVLREERRTKRERRRRGGGVEDDDSEAERDATDTQEKDFMGTMASIFVNAMANFSTQKVEIPYFSGSSNQDPQAHLLAAKDWLDQGNIPLNRRSDKFRLTLKGKARVWYDSLDRDTKKNWVLLQMEFSRHYSLQGRTPKQLCDRWDALSFDPSLDDIDQFIGEVKQTAKQLHLPQIAVVTKIKGKMPQEMAYALTGVHTLEEVVKTVTEVFGRTPGTQLPARDPHAFTALQTSHPSTTVKPTEDRMNSLESTLENLTTAIQQMNRQKMGAKPFRKPPYKPQGAENPGSRGRGRGGYRNTGDRKPGDQKAKKELDKKPERTNFSPRGKYDHSPNKRKPKVASKTVDRDSSRCNYCHNIGHWKRECPELKGNEGKSPTVRFDHLYDSEDEYEDYNGLKDEYQDEGSVEFLNTHQWDLNC